MLGLGLGLQYPRRGIGGGGGFNGIFNQFTGGAFGTSLRLLDSSYTGGLVRVRTWDGIIDQGQADVMPFQIGDDWWVDMNSLLTNLDSTATGRGLTTSNTLADLVDAGFSNYDGFVPTIYEQLNSNNYTQTTALRQGSLIKAGVLNTLNGKPVIKRTTGNDGYLSAYAPNGSGKSLYYIGQYQVIGGTGQTMIGSQSDGSDYAYLVDSSTSTVINSNVSTTNDKINGNPITLTTRVALRDLTINQFLLSSDVNFNFANNVAALGYAYNFPTNYGMFSFQENVFWNNQLDRIGKEANINNAFTIY